MIAYRALAQHVQARVGLSFDETLASIAVVLRALVHQMPEDDALRFRMGVPPELRQLIRETRFTGVAGAPGGRRIVELVGTSLEISLGEAKRRTLAFVEELRAAASPWDDVAFLEILDRFAKELETVAAQAAVA